MSDFEPAFRRTLKFEGVTLEKVAGDSGGLTFCGIARASNPAFPGWTEIDNFLKTLSIKEAAAICVKDTALMSMVKDIYRKKYWDGPGYGKIEDQDLANQVYDAGVNFGTTKFSDGPNPGTSRANKGLQGVLGLMADGMLDERTFEACNHPEPPLTVNGIVDLFLTWRRHYYQTIVAEKPQMEKFLKGWLNRCVKTSEA